MSAHAQLRPIVLDEMGALEEMDLGRRQRVSDVREKLVLTPDHPRAHRLTTRPEADGFIRADTGSLLFRNASTELRNAIPRQLLARAMDSEKGLEFRWTRLDIADIRLLFAVVTWLVTTDSL